MSPLFATGGYLIHCDGDAAIGGLTLDPNADRGPIVLADGSPDYVETLTLDDYDSNDTENPTGDALGAGRCLSPQVKLAWRHDFSDEVVTVAQLAGANTSFRTTAIDVVSDVFDLGAGVDWQIDKNKALCTQYDAEFGSGFTAHTLQACVKILF